MVISETKLYTTKLNDISDQNGSDKKKDLKDPVLFPIKLAQASQVLTSSP